MITRNQIEAIALKQALSVVFCNVGDDDWPVDPIAWLTDDEDADADKNKVMVAWQPFAHFNKDMLLAIVEDYQYDFIWVIDQALTIERG